MGDEPPQPPGASAAIAADVEEKLREALAPHLLLTRMVGSGGMGSVFLAREPALKRDVAVKVLAPDLAANPEARTRFEREAQAVAGLSHPNIVAVHSVGELSDGTPYFVMQYVTGRTMAARLADEGPLPTAEARRVIGEVAAALAAAHAKGIIHRDIKPANILYEEETGRTIVSDFGIAAVTARSEGLEDTRLTQAGMVVGTPQYMSPEQLLNEPAGEKTDIYSLGLLGYELLIGKGPFEATKPHELIAAHLRDVAKPLSELHDDVDAELDGLIARCLEKDAAKRPSADEVSLRLAPGGGALLEWPPPGLEPLHGRLPRLSRTFWLGSLLVLAAILPMLLGETAVSSAVSAPSALLPLLIGGAGAVTLLATAYQSYRLGRGATQAVRDGYAWFTVLETLADRKADVGQLIAGSRAFATLSAERRSVLRLARVARAVTIFFGGIAAVPILTALVVLGSAGVVGRGATWLAVAFPLTCLLVAAVLWLRERRQMGPKRRPRRRRPAPTDISHLAGPWYETFEAVRHGQPLGRGPGERLSLVWAGGLTLGALTAIAVIMLVPLLVAGTLGPATWSILLARYADIDQKALYAEVARPFALPKDSTITPLEAGRAIFALQSGGGLPAREFERAPPRGHPTPPWRGSMPDGLFPTARPAGYDGPDPTKIIPAAMQGFSRAEMVYLERLSHAPQWRDFDRVAHAPSMDYLGARFSIPFPPDLSHWNLPVIRFAILKELAYASVARAAWHLAQGRRDSAEAILRTIISFGFTTADNANSITEGLVGVVIVGVGRSALIQFYSLTGNPDGWRLQTQFDLVRGVFEDPVAAETKTGPYVDAAARRTVREMREDIVAAAGNPRGFRALRLELHALLAFAPCTQVQELVFGPSRDVRSALDRGREQLARYPSEEALLDMMYGGPERVASTFLDDLGVTASVPVRILIGGADLAGAMLRNRRLPGCARTLAVMLHQ